MEVIHYHHNQLAESESAIDRFLHLGDMTIADLTTADVAVGSDLLAGYPHLGIGGRDSTIVAAMDRYGASELWTHDGGLKRLGDTLDWLTVVDPVDTDPV